VKMNGNQVFSCDRDDEGTNRGAPQRQSTTTLCSGAAF
jgi:hypothetical protein